MTAEINPGDSKRPPYKFVDGAPNFMFLVEQAGLNPAIYDVDFLRGEGKFDLYDLFADGELIWSLEHSDFYEAFATLCERANDNEQIRDEINRLARVMGSVLAAETDAGLAPVAPGSTRPRVNPSDGRLSIEFGDYAWTPKRTSQPPIILDFGPGLAGRNFTSAQFEALVRLNPFGYFAVTNGPFVGQFLRDSFVSNIVRTYDKAFASDLLAQQIFTWREDGMQQTTESWLSRMEEAGATGGMGDLILFCAVHKADAHELETTIKLSPGLLRPGGKVMMAAPIEKIEDKYTTFPEELQWATEVGYTVAWQSAQRTGDPRVREPMMFGLAVLEPNQA